MSIQTFATQQTFNGSRGRNSISTMTVKANGGTVTIEVLHDLQNDIWVTDQTIDADAALKVDMTSLGTIRVTPAGGATFSWNG